MLSCATCRYEGRCIGPRATTHLAVLGQVDLERLGIVFEAQRRHGIQDVFAVDRLSLFLMALLRGCDGSVSLSSRDAALPRCWAHGTRRTFAGDKGDKLADALLHALLGLLGNLCVLGEGILHDAGDWSKVANVSIVSVVAVGSLGGRRRGRGTRRFRRLGRRIVRHGLDARRACLGRRAEATPVQQGLVAMQAQRSMAEHTRQALTNHGGGSKERHDIPLAMGNHRSCSFTSKSKPSPECGS